MRQELQDDVSKVIDSELNEITQAFPSSECGQLLTGWEVKANA